MPYGDTIFFTPPRLFIVNLDALPLPARQFLPMRSCKLDYIGFDHLELVASIISSCGCYGHCTFFSSKNIFARKIRYRSAEKVFEEPEEIVQRYLKKVRRGFHKYLTN
jgi:radical SAM superfamily enzyme YgiQ (UPF0313 family)